MDGIPIEAIPSAYNIISSNRSIGYSFESSIADIIDNSISAGATEIELMSPPAVKPVLKISDNGCGMDFEKLTEAMTFGGKLNCQAARSVTDLGRFGMGLKTASLAQCKKLEVITKKNGHIIGGAWDLDYLKDHDGWNYLLIDEEECLKKVEGTQLENIDNGTVVIWSRFDRLKASSSNPNETFAVMMDRAVQKLEIVFHRYLSGEKGINKIDISYNKRPLIPNDPFLSDMIPAIDEPRYINVNGSEVMVLCHKLLHPDRFDHETLERVKLGSSLLETQGFYVYRSKRLIDYGTWFGMAPKLEKTKLSRIQIDIPNTLDSEWSLDIRKSRAFPPYIIRQELRNVLEANGLKSTRTFSNRKKKDSIPYPYWNRESLPGNKNSYLYYINEDQPMITSFREKLPDDKLRKEFEIILSNIARYFPFNLLEQDYQNDQQISGGPEVDQNKETLKDKIRFFLEEGISSDVLKSFFPDFSEILDLDENKVKKEGK